MHRLSARAFAVAIAGLISGCTACRSERPAAKGGDAAASVDRDGEASATLPGDGAAGQHDGRASVSGPCPGRAGFESPRAITGWFPFGIYDDVSRLMGFEAAAADWLAHGLDSALLINGRVSRDGVHLATADRLGLKVIFGPTQDLGGFYRDDVATSIESARRVVTTVVKALKPYGSLKGYNLAPEATGEQADKIALAVRAFAELDPDRPAMPALSFGSTEVYERARPTVFLATWAPARAVRPACNFQSGTAGAYDFVRELRQLVAARAANTPVWLVLQSHGPTKLMNASLPPSVLREPTVEELRLQTWLAVGEGVKGIFWFMYTTLDFWTGLVERPAAFAEIADLARATAKVRETVLRLEKGPDRFLATAEGALERAFRPYVSTLGGHDGRLFAVVVNHACTPQKIAVGTAEGQGSLRDVASGARVELGAAFELRGGDGRLLELVDAPAPAMIGGVPAPVDVPNPSFEIRAGTAPAMWTGVASATHDRGARTGTGALKLTGAATAALGIPVTLKPDTRYVLSFHVRATKVTGAGVGARVVLSSAEDAVTTKRIRGTTSGFVRVERSFYTPADAPGGRLELVWDLARGEVAWVDDVALVEEASACE